MIDTRAGCAGKMALRTFGGAEKVARAVRRARSNHVVPYRCKTCIFWHVGTQLGDNVGRRIRQDRLRKIERRETAHERSMW